MVHPAPEAEQRQAGPEALEGQRERGLPAGRHRRAALDLGEPGALGPVGQAEATDPEVAGRLEQPLLPALAEPPAEPQVHGFAGLAGQPGPGHLRDPVVAEAVARGAVDHGVDPAAAGVDGLEQAQVERRPQALGDRVSAPRPYRRHGVREVELPADAGERAESRGVRGGKLVDRPAEELGDVRGDLDGGEGAQVPCRATVRRLLRDHAVALRPPQQLPDVQWVASGPAVELGCHRTQLGGGAADLGEQGADVLRGQRPELDGGQSRHRVPAGGTNSPARCAPSSTTSRIAAVASSVNSRSES